MELTFKYELETTLTAPDGGILDAIRVLVEIEPQDSGCLIYGIKADGNYWCVEVRGPKNEIDLPFAYPKIYVKYFLGLQNIRISTLGWKDSLR